MAHQALLLVEDEDDCEEEDDCVDERVDMPEVRCGPNENMGFAWYSEQKKAHYVNEPMHICAQICYIKNVFNVRKTIKKRNYECR